MIENNTTESQARIFNPNEHLMKLTGKDYLPVQWRLVWFRSLCPEGTIETEMLHLDLDRETEEEAMIWNEEKRRKEKVIRHANGFAVFRAVIKDGKGGMATGTKSEKAASFADFIEKAETGAIGRALAELGYGTQFTGDEFEEHHRIVDSPVDRGNGASMNGSRATDNQPAAAQHASAPVAEPGAASPITDQQRAALTRVCERLGKSTPQGMDNMTYLAAKELITQLSQEYNQSRPKAS